MPATPILVRLQSTLRLEQKDLAKLLGCSSRTISRNARAGSHLLTGRHATLAATVYPHDREFAAELAAMAGKTLAGLGIEAPPNRGPTTKHLVDSIVCAAAEAMQTPPSLMRPALVAAFERAIALGMRAEDVLRGMAPPPGPPKPPLPAP
ncbi:MAG TPA: hypothetical protein VGL81_35780 [Polyangiaceae bacterium]|jgi:hypothetical protein